MKKNKGTGKRDQGTGGDKELSESFNNPAIVLMKLCYAAQSVWNAYDEISTMASKNLLILTRGERNKISKVDSALLDCYVELDDLMSKRLEPLAAKKIGGAK